MGILQEIKDKVVAGHYEFSKHAVDQSIMRQISVAEIADAFASASEIIEDYPDDQCNDYLYAGTRRKILSY